MKRIVGLSTMFLALTMFVYAQEQSNAVEMMGWICNSKCVNHDKPVAACDASCTEKGGDAVFIDEQGNVTTISNPDMVKGYMGKKMKVKCEKKNGQMQINQLLGIYGM
jgi:hypothetical protein